VDRIAAARWRDHRAPFDALTLATPVLATEQLHAAAARLVGLLRRAFPDAPLHTAEDWHEHDGFVSEPEPAGWEALALAVSSEAALDEWSPTDTYVRRAWLGDGCFYLRWFLYDEGDSPYAATPPAGGEIDLTAQRDVIDEVLHVLREIGIEAAVEPAGEFFSRRWNG
jgi:hypothetical protein